MAALAGQLARRRAPDRVDLAAGLLADDLAPSDFAAAVLAPLFAVLAVVEPAFAAPDRLPADDRLLADLPEPELPVPPAGCR